MHALRLCWNLLGVISPPTVLRRAAADTHQAGLGSGPNIQPVLPASTDHHKLNAIEATDRELPLKRSEFPMPRD